MNTNFVYRSTTFFSWNQYFLYCWLLILLRFTTRDKPNYHCTQHITCPHVIKAYSDCNLYKRYRIPICNKNCHATPSLLLLEQFPRYLNLYIVRVLTKITKQSHTVDHLKTSISSYIIVLVCLKSHSTPQMPTRNPYHCCPSRFFIPSKHLNNLSLCMNKTYTGAWSRQQWHVKLDVGFAFMPDPLSALFILWSTQTTDWTNPRPVHHKLHHQALSFEKNLKIPQNTTSLTHSLIVTV